MAINDNWLLNCGDSVGHCNSNSFNVGFNPDANASCGQCESLLDNYFDYNNNSFYKNTFGRNYCNLVPINALKSNSKFIINSVNISYLNITSLKNKLFLLDGFLDLQQSKFDVLFIGESWLKDSDNAFININGYDSVFSNRKHKIGGGVCCFIKSGYAYSVLTNESVEDSSILVIRIDNLGTFCGFYRAPQTKVDLFIRRLESIILEHKNVMFLGDINIDLLSDSQVVSNYMNFMNSLNYTLINKIDHSSFTYHCGNHFSILDHIFHNLNNLNVRFMTKPVSFSNHCLIVASYNLRKSDSGQSNSLISKSIDYEKLCSKIEEVDPSDMDYNTFIALFSTLISDCTSTRHIKSKYKKRNLWISNEAINLINQRESIKHKCCKDPCNIDLKNKFF